MVSEELLSAAASAWDEAVELASATASATARPRAGADRHHRPDDGLRHYRYRAGPGPGKGQEAGRRRHDVIVNQTVPRALKALGYTKPKSTTSWPTSTSKRPSSARRTSKTSTCRLCLLSMGDNAIHYLGHVKMMSAVQPFISGAISKTVNMPEEVTVEEVEQLHMDAWKMGLKAVAIYRDNCKVAQPLSMAKKAGSTTSPLQAAADKPIAIATPTEIVTEVMVPRGAVRRELPKMRTSKTFSFRVADSRGFFTVGEYDDGTPGELFISVSKMGSTLRGLMDAFAISISYGLQYGVPLKSYARVFSHMSFAPSGITDDPEIRTASSIVDYIFRRLAMTYLSFDDRLELGLANLDDMPANQTSFLDEEAVPQLETDAQVRPQPSQAIAEQPVNELAINAQPAASAPASQPTTTAKSDEAPMCFNCGNMTQRAGSCYVCTACGSTTGCS
jgi:ribonucleoside-diphosphate reductase alpha chain